MAGKQSIRDHSPRKALATEFTDLLDALKPDWMQALNPTLQAKFNVVYRELSKLDDRALDREGRRGS